MQDTFCPRVISKFSFGAAAGKERGLQLLSFLAADMKSAEEGNVNPRFKQRIYTLHLRAVDISEK